jgi:hypothetical protein
MPVNFIYKLYVRAVRHGNDNIITTLEQPGATPENRVLAMRVLTDGSLGWTGAPVVLSSFLSNKGRIPIAIDSQGVVKTVWEDSRNDSSDLYAQNINADGTLGPAGAPCYANCDVSTAPPILNVADFGCFLQKFAAADPYANCDNSTQEPVLNVADFGCFLGKFAAGCR